MLFIVFNYIKVVAGSECCNNHSIWSNLHLRVESDALIIFALYLSVIGPENSCSFLNQSDVKLNPNYYLVARVFPRFWKMENALFFVKRQFVILSRDWIETYSSFDWNAQRKVNRDTRLSYFREMQNYNSQLSCGTESWNYCTFETWNDRCLLLSVKLYLYSSHSHGKHLIK